MSFISDILGIENKQDMQIPQMTSILPQSVVSLIDKGTLPVLNIDTLMLLPKESCHYVDKACLLITKSMITHYDGNRGGISFNVMKGVTLRGGKSRITPVRENISTITPGYLHITSSRIVFTASENAFEKQIQSLTSATPYSNALSLQFKNTVFNIFLPSPLQAFNVLLLLRQQ